MARAKETKVVKAMKTAKTAEEMLDSWWVQRPGAKRGPNPTDFWAKRKPEMIFTYAHNQLTQVAERGILDPKTQYLISIACYMMEGHWQGLLAQCCNAKAAGATEEEIMETAFMACYAVSKAKMVDTAAALSQVFENPNFKNTKLL